MKIYYSRTNGTNDAINGAVLQEIIKNLDIVSNVELMRYESGEPYGYGKLDSADVMIIGYNYDNIINEGCCLVVGKGVYDECNRAFNRNIPVYFINVDYNEYYEIHNPFSNEFVGLERIELSDDSDDIYVINNGKDWKNYAEITIHDDISNDTVFGITLNQSTQEWRDFFKTIDWSKYPLTSEESIINTENTMSVNIHSPGNNKFLLLLCR